MVPLYVLGLLEPHYFSMMILGRARLGLGCPHAHGWSACAGLQTLYASLTECQWKKHLLGRVQVVFLVLSRIYFIVLGMLKSLALCIFAVSVIIMAMFSIRRLPKSVIACGGGGASTGVVPSPSCPPST